MQKQAVAYIRTSTARQNLGLEAQTAAITSFAAQYGFDVAATYSEQESGGDDHRPELTAALDQAKRLKAPVIVAKLDRLSRDVHLISGLMKHRVPFIVTELGIDTDSPITRLYLVDRILKADRQRAQQFSFCQHYRPGPRDTDESAQSRRLRDHRSEKVSGKSREGRGELATVVDVNADENPHFFDAVPALPW
jgi:hypothetical protein